MSPSNWLMGFTLPPRAGRPDPVNAQTAVRTVSAGYFRALGVELAAGRTYTETDTAAGPPLVIVNEAFARSYLDGQGIGARVPLGGPRTVPRTKSLESFATSNPLRVVKPLVPRCSSTPMPVPEDWGFPSRCC